MSKRIIELELNHNYLQIKEGTKTMQLPLRCAKIIRDMYDIRNADNEREDILHYSAEDYSNAEYCVGVHIMNVPFDNVLAWNSIVIKPFDIKK